MEQKQVKLIGLKVLDNNVIKAVELKLTLAIFEHNAVVADHLPMEWL